MKKILSILLAVLLVASLGVTAFAADENTQNYDSVGMNLTLPKEYEQLRGVLYLYPMGMLMEDPDVAFMQVLYFAMPKADFEKAMQMDDSELTEEEVNAFRNAQGQLGTVVVTDDVDGMIAEVIAEGASLEDAGLEIIGEADGYTFLYAPAEDEDYLNAIGEYAEEYRSLQGSFPTVLMSATFYAPVDPAKAMVGMTFKFETTDVDGNKVTSDELFGNNEVTMINYWGTWCHWCVEEMPELAKINERLAEKNCGIIGIVNGAEAGDQESLDDAKAVMMETGVKYPNVVPSDDMNEILDQVSSFPCTFFVDKTGTILCPPIFGAAVDEYEATVNSLLKGTEVDRPASKSASANGLACYRVLVYDVDGNPVQGVAIQFCSDDACNMAKTDADGIARFAVDEGMEYTVHVLKVPEGYAKDAGEYKTETAYSDVMIFLNAA